MINKLLALFTMLKPDQKTQFIKLQLLVALMSSFEMISVFGVTGFIALITDPSVISEIELLTRLLSFLGLQSNFQIILFIGFLIAFLLISSTFLSVFTIWKLSHYSQSVGFSLGNRLFQHYLTQPWKFHLSINSSELVKRISTETDRVTNGVLNQVMQINSRFILGIFLSASIIYVDPIVALIGVAIIGFSYLLIYKFVKNTLKNNGEEISEKLINRFKIMSNAFGGIRELIISKKYSDYISKFNNSGDILVKRSASSIALTQIPRFIVETLAFVLIISLIVSLYFSYSGNLDSILPVVAFYAFSGFKLIPCFQQIYGAIAQIRTHISAFDSISNDLQQLKNKNIESLVITKSKDDRKPLFNKSLKLEKICFSYELGGENALKNIDLEISSNECIGITGPSGSGKSTLIDIILGLHTPQKGNIYIDGFKKKLDYWENNKWLIGYVPQDIFLADASILDNILMGDDSTESNKAKILQLLANLELLEFLDKLPDGINTEVGERGVQLSGGQKQKIAIARCLYNKAELIVFDEATSSLDGASENEIMKNIKVLSQSATVILIAHRLSTLRDCNQIHFIENGSIVESGTYSQLSETDSHFRAMLNGVNNK